MVDLKQKPYNLDDSQIEWVEKIISSMTLDEKLSQLFTILTATRDENYLKEVTKTCKFGGVRFNPGTAKEIFDHNKIIQENSKVPVFIAANTESGGNGACKGGTEVGYNTKVASTNDLKLAYKLGDVCAKEAKAIGINTLFSPIVDIHHDFHNPIIAYKTFGNDPIKVRDYSLEYLRAVNDNKILACAKHFPGDGFDERDQHLSPSVNPLSVEEWDNSFGLVYKALIDEGLPMIMAGHISLPSYVKLYSEGENKNLFTPATLSSEIIEKLLRTKLGFNGVVTTDATHMVALTCAMKREDLIPQVIASGVDMILFYNDFEEDFSFIKAGYEKGIITEERLSDALHRIIGLKAKLGYDKTNAADQMKEENLKIVGCEEHTKISNEVAKKGIVLVKNLEKVLPLNKDKIKNILIVTETTTNPFESLMPKGIPTIFDYIKSKLENEGFNVEIFESLMDKAKKAPPMEAFKIIGNIYNNKTPVKDLTYKYDLIIHFCDIDTHNTVSRIEWKMSKGTPDVPWYVYEVPTIMISLRNPFHLFDAPQVKTYINAYDKNKNTIDALIEKLMGRDEFVGTSPVDAFCGNEICKY